MKTLQFKTNINCDTCTAKVTPVLNGLSSVEKWEADTKNPSKILTVQGENISEKEIVESLAEIGYKAERL